jgi:hypothetical protein
MISAVWDKTKLLGNSIVADTIDTRHIRKVKTKSMVKSSGKSSKDGRYVKKTRKEERKTLLTATHKYREDLPFLS